MRKLALVFAIITMPYVAHGAFTEFFVSNTSNTAANVNAGDGQPLITSTNGAWDSTNSSFTAASGTPFSAVSTGTFGTVYLDGVSTTSYEARISTVQGSGATLVFSLTAFAGTTGGPATSSTGRSCTVGGYWSGPSATIQFPFGFVTAVLTDPVADTPRVNFQSGSPYIISAAISHALAGPIYFQGYGVTPGDGGKPTITTGIAGFNVVTINATDGYVGDFIMTSTATSSTGNVLTISGAEMTVERIVITQSRSSCLAASGAAVIYNEIETYNCNLSNTASQAGILTSQFSYLNRCFAHDITGSNSSGIRFSLGVSLNHCVVSNITSGVGIFNANSSLTQILNTDVYGSGSDGLRMSDGGETFYMENSNFVNNGGYGVNFLTAANQRSGALRNCGFFGNTSGDILNSTFNNLIITGKINYTSNPFISPTTGDFRLKVGQAFGTGRGTFLVQGSTFSYVNYPNVGSDIKRPFPGGALSVSN